MNEAWIEVPVKGGSMAAFRVGAGERAIVMLQEVFGVNPAMQDKARKFAALGYTVLVPDLFWRMQPRVSLGYAGKDRERAFELFGKFDFAAGIADIAATARSLKSEQVAVMGFCLGGKLAVASTAAYPFRAVASLYGVKLEADKERLKAIDVPLQIHVGDKDAHVPMEAVEQIKDALKGKPNAEVFVYPGAQHGFFNAARAEVYSPDAANQAQVRIVGMLKKAL
ncbi:MAG TPA: dienelactone hydrolase family protein [Burkholderiales bacterium]|nr:dienelactone hydrolase family protein [Burkholderiales bacterium]